MRAYQAISVSSVEMTPSEQAALIKMVLELFDQWGLDTASRLILLGLSPNSRAILSHYRKRSVARLPYDTLDRIGWLLIIHQSLRSLFPEQTEVCYSWVKCRQLAFDQLTPLQCMKSEGLIGIAKVARYLQSQLVK